MDDTELKNDACMVSVIIGITVSMDDTDEICHPFVSIPDQPSVSFLNDLYY